MAMPQSLTKRQPRRAWIAPAVYAALVLTMFGDVLFSRGATVLSHSSTDLSLQFIPWRQFGFSELRRGNLALWNPHMYGGAPYFAGFQSALLYPPNWLHLILPLGVAINWITALHVFLAGYFTYLWARYRGVSIAGSILAGAMFMFGGPYFLHIYAGHLPHVAVMIWAPLILLAIDGLALSGSWRRCLLGAFAVAMQVLAGHPQYVYYTAIAMTAYVALNLIKGRHRAILIGGFVIIYVGGALLSAAQLLPGIDAQSESIRSAGTGYEFASTFSLPPWNFLTLVAPNFFGRLPMTDAAPPDSYWGAGYLWEMSLFVSITGLVLAIYGAVTWRGTKKWIIVAMITIAMLLALGRHTPLYRPMLNLVPKYSSFRGTVKFAYLAVLFASLLAGVGFDDVRRRRPGLTLPLTLGGFAIILIALGVLIRPSPAWWESFVRSTGTSAHDARELFVKPLDAYQTATLIEPAAARASRSLFFAGGTVVAIAAVTSLIRWSKRAACGLMVLAIAELFTFARSMRATMPLVTDFPETASPQIKSCYPAWRDAIRRLAPDRRGLNVVTEFANASMSLGYNDLWGYDPGVQKRWAELLAATQGVPPKNASQYLAVRQINLNIFRMLRCAAVLTPNPQRPVIELPNPLPVATVISDWVKFASVEPALSYMLQDNFDPTRTIVLESESSVKTQPAAEPPGYASVVAGDTDWMEIHATLTRPGILLITNSYSSGWRASPLAPSSQTEYDIVPADWALMGIPLGAGAHHLRLEYLPRSFTIGKWLSIFATLGFAALLAAHVLSHARAKNVPITTTDDDRRA
jgi:hypothetical protein